MGEVLDGDVAEGKTERLIVASLRENVSGVEVQAVRSRICVGGR